MARRSLLVHVFALALLALLAGACAPSAGAASGSSLWTRFYEGGFGATDAFRHVAKGPAGSVYVAGSCFPGAATANDIVVARYSAKGKRLWLERFAGPGDSADSATDVVVDGSGNLYVCGAAWTAFGYPGYDGESSLVLAKYSPAGHLLWSDLWTDAFGGVNSASALALAKGGGVYVAGTSTGMGTGLNIVLLHYSGAGVQQWGGAERYVGPAGDDRAQDVAVDADGNAYVTGSGPNLAGDSDAIVVKWNAAGVRKWGQLYDSGAVLDDYGRHITVTPGGTAYVSGWIARTGGDLDWLLLKYTTGGTKVWAKKWGGSAHGADTPADMAMDGKRNVYLTGYSYGASYARCVTRKYSPGGKVLWSRTIKKAPGIRGETIAVAGGYVYLGGFTGGATLRAMVARYTSGGAFSWLRTWRASAGGDAYADDVAVVPGKAFWLVGEAVRTGTGFDAFVQKRVP